MTLFDRLQTMARKRADYTRTVRELRNMSLDVALDLDIRRADAKRIARKAVYGA